MDVAGTARVGPYELRWGAATHPGHHRELNEDSFVVVPGIYVVADGMGGHEAGDLASAIAVATFGDPTLDRPPDIEALEQLVASANREIIARADVDGSPGMGTTVVGCAVVRNGSDHSLVVFNIGDSRCYRYADGRLTQLTIDHSHVQELVSAGEIGADEARDHPLRNVVTRALGTDEIAVADYRVLDDTGPIRLVLCSDGLSGELDDTEIAALLEPTPDPQRAADELLAAALRGAARDNVTAVVVAIEPDATAVDLHDTQPRGLPAVITGERPVPAHPGDLNETSEASVGGPTSGAWAPPSLIDAVPGLERPAASTQSGPDHGTPDSGTTGRVTADDEEAIR